MTDPNPPSMDLSDGPSETRFSVVIEGRHLDITEAVEEAARDQTADLRAAIEVLTAEHREALLDFRRQTKRAEAAEAKAIEWRDRATAAEAEVNNLRTKYDILDGGYRALVSRCKKEVARAEKAEAERDAAMAGAVEPCGGCGETDPNRRCIGCLHPFTKPTSAAQPDPVTLTYRNWRGEISDRTIIPRRVWFGSTEWHPDPQWLLTAWDTEKNAERDFALADFLGRPGEREALIEALRDLINSHAEICVDLDDFESNADARVALAAAENTKAGVEDRSSVLTALAVRDSQMRTKVMREALDIIANIERDEKEAGE